jgi:anti-sigma factor ChrR (cupin superfamily)
LAGISFFWVDGGPRVANAFRGFMRVDAGLHVYEHKHIGDERVLVLQGAYEDLVTRAIVRPGELAHNGPGSSHAIRALPDRPDLLKLVVVQDGMEVAGQIYRPA